MQQLKIMQSLTQRDVTVNRYLSEISRYPMISPEEEFDIAMRAKDGANEAFNRLVEANLRFVVSVAKQYQGHGMTLSDLINEGNMGLIKAASKFDPTRGFKFISYAVWWIRQTIIQAMSDDGRMVRLPLNQIGAMNKISKARASFLQENEREPTDEELSQLVDITPGKIAEVIRSSSTHMSFDTPLGEDGDGTLLDIVPDASAPETDASLNVESLRSDIEDVLSILPQRERDIIHMSFGIGCAEKTLEEIGTALNLTRERVRQLKEKAIRRISRPAAKLRLAQYL